jgi:hypothetical protein
MHAYVFPAGSSRSENSMERFSFNPLTSIKALDYEGVTFNWNTRVLAVCGGLQVKMISLNKKMNNNGE